MSPSSLVTSPSRALFNLPNHFINFPTPLLNITSITFIFNFPRDFQHSLQQLIQSDLSSAHAPSVVVPSVEPDMLPRLVVVPEI